MNQKYINLENIRANWDVQVGNEDSEQFVWNSMADNYAQGAELPSEKNSKSLRIVTENRMYDKNSSVLDVGCGTGRFSAVFAERCKAVTGVDFSMGMLDRARCLAAEKNLSNVEFVHCNWQKTKLEQYGWEKQFDLVFANMSPAVQSAETFDMLSQASRGWCFMSKPVNWKHSIIHDLVEKIGLGDVYRTFDMDMLYAYNTLILQGYLPKVDYDTNQWVYEGTIEEAYKRYVSRIDMKFSLTDRQKQMIKEYLNQIAEDGRIRERTEVTVSMLYWHV